MLASSWRWIIRRRWPILTTVMTATLGILGILVGINPAAWKWLLTTPWGRVIFAAFACAAIFFAMLSLRDTDAVADLRDKLAGREDEIDRLQVENARLRDDNRGLFETNLRHLAESLEFTFDERITVYEYTDDGFVSIGRYSLNDKLRRPGRPACPTNEGVIAKAWEGKLAFVGELPDPVHDFDAYCREIARQCQVPADTCRNLKMKSRSLFAHCILDALGDGPVAVIVFESLNPGRLNPEQLKAAMKNEENRIKSYLEQRRTAPLRMNGRRQNNG